MTSILILDDDATSASGWCDSIQDTLGKNVNVSVVSQVDAANEIEILLNRQRSVRNNGKLPSDESIFDGVDVLIVDYDLVHISKGHGRFTGEGICRLAHAFSSSGLVVVLNQFVEADFDLSQRGNPSSSHADLNISANHVANKGLWTESDWEDFRPWHWPILPDAAYRHRQLVELLSADISAPLLPKLGFTPALAEYLTDDAFGFINPNARTIDDLMNVTLADFLTGNSHATDSRDGAALCQYEVPHRLGLAASRIAKWLRRMVVGPRNLIIDLPHLVERYPFLLPTEKLGDPASWNELITNVPTWFEGRLPDNVLVSSETWSRVPHVWLPHLEADKDFQEQRYDFVFSDAPKLVFAEDHSKFISEDEAKMFKAEFNNEFDRRFVKEIAGIKYAPKRRFAL